MTAGERAATLVWQGVVPLLPFVLLLNVRLWRNVCPLGRISEGSSSAGGAGHRAALGVAVLAFAAILPLRAAWFAESLAVTAGFLLLLAAVARLLGRRGARRSGFCTTLCPMLPVELLYGQAPLLRTGRGACATCSLCTLRACPQLSPRAAIAQHLGAARRGAGWTLTPFGAFAGAFPGVIAAFFAVEHPGVADAAVVLVAGAATSWAVVTAVVVGLRPRWDRAVLTLGFVCIALWSWLALPGVAGAWGVPSATEPLRIFGFGLALLWYGAGLRNRSATAGFLS